MPIAMLRGTSRPGATSSSHPNTHSSTQAGQEPSDCGYGSRSDRPLAQGRASRSATSNSAVQGLSSPQTLPTNAQRKLKPTHQMIQTETGARFLNVF
jgi:hypothetical protein